MRPEDYFNQPLVAPTIKDMRRKDYLYASALGFLTTDGRVFGGCRRKEYLRITGVPESNPPSLDAYRKMLYGEYVGLAEVELAKKARIYVGDEVAIQDDIHRISGRIDLVILDPNATVDPYIGVEHKSIHGDWAIKKKINPYPGSALETDPGHLAQVVFYASVYRAAIKRWWARYLARCSGQTRCHEIVLLPDGKISANGRDTGRTLSELHAWADSVWTAINTKQPMEPDYELIFSVDTLKKKAAAGELNKTNTEKVNKGHKVVTGDWHCAYCSYTNTCWSGKPLPFDLTLQDALRRVGA